MRTQLLCTFTKSRVLSKTVDKIIDTYDILYNKLFVLNNNDNKSELMCTYNIDSSRNVEIISDTISLHRKKQTNTLYTINALNEAIRSLNNGVLDKSFAIPWENYQNNLLLTNEEGLNIIPTKIFKIINVKDW